MSTNIKFENGMKSFVINGDENKVIYFNPNDFNILKRIDTAVKNIEEISKKYEQAQINNDSVMTMFSQCDKEIREQINFVFGNDVCTVAFGNSNCLSFAGGKPICMNFLDAVVPILKSEIKAEQEKSKKNIEKYTKQVKK